MWLAAEKAMPNRSHPFTDYALLGDDIVIADGAVAREYALLLDRLGVSISIPKSIISKNGYVEFAKRFWGKSMQIDLSPISLRALWGSRTLIGICHLAFHCKVTNFAVLCRLAGAGYRVRSRLTSHLLDKEVVTSSCDLFAAHPVV